MRTCTLPAKLAPLATGADGGATATAVAVAGGASSEPKMMALKVGASAPAA